MSSRPEGSIDVSNSFRRTSRILALLIGHVVDDGLNDRIHGLIEYRGCTSSLPVVLASLGSCVRIRRELGSDGDLVGHFAVEKHSDIRDSAGR